MRPSCQNKVSMGGPNYIKEMEINWESFVFVREKISFRKKSFLNDMFI